MRSTQLTRRRPRSLRTIFVAFVLLSLMLAFVSWLPARGPSVQTRVNAQDQPLQIRDLSHRMPTASGGLAAIEGWVKSENKEPIPGAKVSFAGKIVAETDGEGYFSLPPEALGLSGDAGNTAAPLSSTGDSVGHST
jgi:hypothetical protein